MRVCVCVCVHWGGVQVHNFLAAHLRDPTSNPTCDRLCSRLQEPPVCDLLRVRAFYFKKIKKENHCTDNWGAARTQSLRLSLRFRRRLKKEDLRCCTAEDEGTEEQQRAALRATGFPRLPSASSHSHRGPPSSSCAPSPPHPLLLLLRSHSAFARGPRGGGSLHVRNNNRRRRRQPSDSARLLL